MHVGDIIRDRSGSWVLWRVVQTFDDASPLVLAVKIINTRAHHAGTRDVLRKDNYQIERDILGFVRRTHGYWWAFVAPDRWLTPFLTLTP